MASTKDPVLHRGYAFARPRMPPRVHPCLCGFVCETYPQMRHHRAKCLTWRTRRDPGAITRERLVQTHREKVKGKSDGICSVCEKRPDHHEPTCPHSQAEACRRGALERNGIDPEWFDQFLAVMAKRYPSPI